jgi:ABC-type Zn2+ transport system substrate-binding protein/surface adhesin
MKKFSFSFLLPLVWALASLGCGAKEQGAEHPHDHAKDEHGKGGHEHGKDHHAGEGDHKHGHPELQGAVKDLHGVLAPVYHMEKGAARNDAACAKVSAYKEKSAAVVTEAKPEAKPKAEELSKTAADLEAACGGDKATVEAKFEVFHDAFHKVMDASK